MPSLFPKLALAALLPLLGTAAAEEEKSGIDIALVSETPAVAPSRPFTVALKVHHHPDFHTYWQNPGIVGMPFEIKWQLPPGFTAGEIQWPRPEKVKMAGHPAYGYERDIMLLVEINPPAELPKPVELKAAVTWMACAKGCFPGDETLSLTLPATGTGAPDTSDPQLAAAFTQARNEIPRPLKDWKATIESAKDAPEIRVRFTGPAIDPATLHFFSTDGQISSDPPQKIDPLPDGFRLTASRAEYSPKGCATLPGVLTGLKPTPADPAEFGTTDPAYPK